MSTENRTIPVGTEPFTEVYAPGLGRIFVVNGGGSNLTVLNALTLDPVGSIPDPGNVYSVAYDAENGLLYLPLYYGNDLEAINATTGRMVTEIPLLDGPYEAALDTASGFVFVTENSGSRVAVVNTSSEEVVDNISVSGYPGAIEYDNLTDRIYVTTTTALVVIDASDDQVIASLDSGYDPQTAILDPATDELFVPNFYSDNVSYFNDTTLANLGHFNLSGGVLFGAYDPVDGDLYIGLGSDSQLAIVNASSGQLQATVDTGIGPGGILFDPLDESVLVANEGADTLTAVASPLNATGALEPDVTDAGVPVTLRAEVEGGFAPYEYSWSFGDGQNASASSDPTVSHTYTLSGPYTASLNVTDSGGYNASGNLNVEVQPDPEVSAPQATPRSIDAGGTTTLNASAFEGVPPYRFTWSGLPVGCDPDGADRATCQWTAAGTWPVTVSATDAVGGRSVAAALDLLVEPDPTVVVTVARSTADVGQTIVLTAVTTYGIGPFAYAWRGLPGACTFETDTATCRTTVPENVPVEAEANDSSGVGSGWSAPVNLSIDALPAASIGSNATAFESGIPFDLSATGTYGSGGYQFQWQGLPTGCGLTGAVVQCDAEVGAATNFSATVLVTDSNGGTNVSAPFSFTVVPSLAASSVAFTGPVVAGVPATFEVSSSGGVRPYAYTWEFGGGTTATGARVSHVFGAPGSYPVEVWVNDSDGAWVLRTTVVDVVAPAASNGLSETLVIAGLAASAVSAAGIAAFVLRRRRTARTAARVRPPRPPRRTPVPGASRPPRARPPVPPG